MTTIKARPGKNMGVSSIEIAILALVIAFLFPFPTTATNNPTNNYSTVRPADIRHQHFLQECDAFLKDNLAILIGTIGAYNVPGYGKNGYFEREYKRIYGGEVRGNPWFHPARSFGSISNAAILLANISQLCREIPMAITNASKLRAVALSGNVKFFSTSNSRLLFRWSAKEIDDVGEVVDVNRLHLEYTRGGILKFLKTLHLGIGRAPFTQLIRTEEGIRKIAPAGPHLTLYKAYFYGYPIPDITYLEMAHLVTEMALVCETIHGISLTRETSPEDDLIATRLQLDRSDDFFAPPPPPSAPPPPQLSQLSDIAAVESILSAQSREAGRSTDVHLYAVPTFTAMPIDKIIENNVRGEVITGRKIIFHPVEDYDNTLMMSVNYTQLLQMPNLAVQPVYNEVWTYRQPFPNPYYQLHYVPQVARPMANMPSNRPPVISSPINRYPFSGNPITPLDPVRIQRQSLAIQREIDYSNPHSSPIAPISIPRPSYIASSSYPYHSMDYNNFRTNFPPIQGDVTNASFRQRFSFNTPYTPSFNYDNNISASIGRPEIHSINPGITSSPYSNSYSGSFSSFRGASIGSGPFSTTSATYSYHPAISAPTNYSFGVSGGYGYSSSPIRIQDTGFSTVRELYTRNPLVSFAHSSGGSMSGGTQAMISSPTFSPAQMDRIGTSFRSIVPTPIVTRTYIPNLCR